MHTTIAAVSQTKSFPSVPNHYFNISGFYHVAKNKKKIFYCAFVGPPFCGRPLFGRTCLNPPLQLSYFTDHIKEPERSSTVDLVGIVSRPLIITVSRGSRQRRSVGHSDDDDEDDAVTILLNNALTDLNGDKNCALNPYSNNNCHSSGQ